MSTGIAKASELAQAGKDAMTDFEVMVMAAEIAQTANHISQDELIHLLFKYSATLTANVATRITHILMSESELNDMVSDIQMFDEIANDVLGGN